MLTVNYAMRVATQLHHEGRLSQANSILDMILTVHPTHAYALHLSGVIAYQAGQIMTGIEFIQRAITYHAPEALFHSNLGEMYRQLNFIDLSIEHGERAIAIDEKSATALANLGIAYYDAKQYEKAEECHQRALAIHPTCSRSLNNMGSIYKMYGKINNAITFYQAAINAEPTFVEPFNNLGALFLQQQAFKEAIEYSRQAICLLPTFADAHGNLGLALLGLDHPEEALLHFEKALQFKSDCAQALYGMAKIQLQNQQFIESENNIRKALLINSQQIECYHLLADIHANQSNHEKALMHLDHALSLDPSFASTYLSKGNILMEMGNIFEAQKQFIMIIDDKDINNRLLAHYSLVQLKKIEENDPSLKTLLAINENIAEISPTKQEYLYFALGKCHDDIDESAKAFAYFKQGCHLKRQRIHYQAAEQIQLTNTLIHTFTKETIEYLRRFAHPSVKPIFIVGMPRSGTTLVEQILASHAEVQSAGELTYLLDQIALDRIQSPAFYDALTKKYLAHLQCLSLNAMHIIDKMPQNFMIIGLIHALFPNAKIIHVKRHPIDTCLSCYTKLFSRGQYYSYDLIELGQYYHCYQVIMNHWQHVLPMHAWLDVTYENIIQHVEAETKQLLAYCQLNWDPACLDFYKSKRNVRTASFMQVRQPIYTSSVNRFKKYENELTPLINILTTNKK